MDRRSTVHRRPVLFRIAAIGLGLVFGFVLFATLLDVFSRVTSSGERLKMTAEPLVGTATSPGASRFAYAITPWFHAFQERALNLRTLLVPFGDVGLECDSQTRFGQSQSCNGGRQNSQGFRVPEYTIAHPPDTFRIVIVGDSFTWGDGIDGEALYHQRLQKRFHETRMPGEPAIEVIGLGINGSNIWDNVTRLFVHGSHLRPDLVLVQYTDNDLDYRGYEELLAAGLGGDGLDFILEETAIGRALRKYGREQMWLAERKRRHESESLEWRLFEASLEALADWKRENGVPVAFLLFSPIDRNPRTRNLYDYGERLPSLPWQRKVERAIGTEGFPLLRTLDAFQARAGGRQLAVSRANGHYNQLANQLVSDAIFDFLTTADWVDLGSVSPGAADERWAVEQALRRRAQDSWSEFHRSYELQRELFEQLLELFPENAWLTQSLAFVLRELGDVERSRALYLWLATLEPQHAAPWYDLAIEAQDRTERETLLVRMLVEVPDHVAAAEKLAELDVAAGRIGRACGCFRRVTRLSNYPGQFGRAFEAFRDHRCDLVSVEPCPGQDPLRPLP